MKLTSQISPNSEQFKANVAAHEAALAETNAAAEAAQMGGGEKSRVRHTGRGKLLPRERVQRLLDPGTPFLEVGMFAGHGLYGGACPSGGMIAGVGRCLLYTSPSPRD